MASVKESLTAHETVDDPNGRGVSGPCMFCGALVGGDVRGALWHCLGPTFVCEHCVSGGRLADLIVDTMFASGAVSERLLSDWLAATTTRVWRLAFMRTSRVP
jgi:hypothetical protein